MFIRLTYAKINLDANDPENELVEEGGQFTLNTDCIERYSEIQMYYESCKYIPYTVITLKDGRTIDVAESSEYIDSKLCTRRTYHE